MPNGPRALHGGRPITTDATLRRDLELSLKQSLGAGRTIGDFFAAVLSLGLSLHDELSSVEYGVGQSGTGRLTYERDADGRVEVTEIFR